MAPPPMTSLPPKASMMGMQQQQTLLQSVIEGLYHDRIFPSAAMLRQRLQEQSDKPVCDDGDARPWTLEELVATARFLPKEFEVDEYEPKQSTTAMPALLGRVSRSSVRSITLVKPPVWFEGFVDPASDDDQYKDAVWSGFEQYLANLARLVRSRPARTPDSSVADGPHTFRGGHYETARELQRRRLPFFENMRLGEICHIVQIGLGKRKLLLREDDVIIPSAVHGKSASIATSATRVAANEKGVHTHADLAEVVEKALRGLSEGLDLSMLKAKILETSNVRINENAFGCPKLLDLLRLPAVARVCRVEKRRDNWSAYRIFLRDGSRDIDEYGGVVQSSEETIHDAQHRFPSLPLAAQHIPPATACGPLLSTDPALQTQGLMPTSPHVAQVDPGWEASMQASPPCLPAMPFHASFQAEAFVFPPPGLSQQVEGGEYADKSAWDYLHQPSAQSQTRALFAECDFREAIAVPLPSKIMVGQRKNAAQPAPPRRFSKDACQELLLLDGEPAYVPLPQMQAIF